MRPIPPPSPAHTHTHFQSSFWTDTCLVWLGPMGCLKPSAPCQLGAQPGSCTQQELQVGTVITEGGYQVPHRLQGLDAQPPRSDSKTSFTSQGTRQGDLLGHPSVRTQGLMLNGACLLISEKAWATKTRPKSPSDWVIPAWRGERLKRSENTILE